MLGKRSVSNKSPVDSDSFGTVKLNGIAHAADCAHPEEYLTANRYVLKGKCSVGKGLASCLDGIDPVCPANLRTPRCVIKAVREAHFSRRLCQIHHSVRGGCSKEKLDIAAVGKGKLVRNNGRIAVIKRRVPGYRGIPPARITVGSGRIFDLHVLRRGRQIRFAALGRRNRRRIEEFFGSTRSPEQAHMVVGCSHRCRPAVLCQCGPADQLNLIILTAVKRVVAEKPYRTWAAAGDHRNYRTCPGVRRRRKPWRLRSRSLCSIDQICFGTDVMRFIHLPGHTGGNGNNVYRTGIQGVVSLPSPHIVNGEEIIGISRSGPGLL